MTFFLAAPAPNIHCLPSWPLNLHLENAAVHASPTFWTNYMWIRWFYYLDFWVLKKFRGFDSNSFDWNLSMFFITVFLKTFSFLICYDPVRFIPCKVRTWAFVIRCRNIFAVQQCLTNITTNRESDLDHARQYYELLYHSTDVSLSPLRFLWCCCLNFFWLFLMFLT